MTKAKDIDLAMDLVASLRKLHERAEGLKSDLDLFRDFVAEDKALFHSWINFRRRAKREAKLAEFERTEMRT